MATEIELSLRDVDFMSRVREHPLYGGLRSALEAQPLEAGEHPETIIERYFTFIFDAAGTPELETFKSDLKELNDLQAKIQSSYGKAQTVTGATRAKLQAELRPLQERQGQLFDSISRYPDVDRMSANIDDVAQREADGLSGSDADDEDRAGVGRTDGEPPKRSFPDRPRESAARTKSVVAAIQKLIDPKTSGFTSEAVRPASYGKEQFRLLMDLDPTIAGQGMEANISGHGFDVKVDGLQPLAGGTFNLLEAKYNSPDLPSIYSESRGGGGGAEGSFRDEISRLSELRRALEPSGARDIVVVTNTEASRAAIATMLDSMGLDAGARAHIKIVVNPI